MLPTSGRVRPLPRQVESVCQCLSERSRGFGPVGGDDAAVDGHRLAGPLRAMRDQVDSCDGKAVALRPTRRPARASVDGAMQIAPTIAPASSCRLRNA